MEAAEVEMEKDHFHLLIKNSVVNFPFWVCGAGKVLKSQFCSEKAGKTESFQSESAVQSGRKTKML